MGKGGYYAPALGILTDVYNNNRPVARVEWNFEGDGENILVTINNINIFGNKDLKNSYTEPSLNGSMRKIPNDEWKDLAPIPNQTSGAMQALGDRLVKVYEKEIITLEEAKNKEEEE